MSNPLKKNVRIAAEERVIKINKYKPGTPFYCVSLVYFIIVMIATAIDWVTLYSLYDAVLNGSRRIAIITSFGIVAVLDLYSCWLPTVLDYMSKKKKTIIFGIALAAIIALIGALSVTFRISTGDVTTSTTEVHLSNTSNTVLNVVLGCIPIASTLAMLFLSIQKDYWNKANSAYQNEQILIPLKAREKELELSIGETIDLQGIDSEEEKTTIEIMKAYAIQAKSEARYKFATALGDSESAKTLSGSVLPDYISEHLKPAPFENTDKEDNSGEEES